MTTCWTLTETGLRGTENQCLALAHAAGMTPEIKRIRLRQPWKTLTPWVKHFASKALTPDSSPLTAPWPDVLIASGRKAIAPALWIKKQSQGRTKLVIVQSPVIKSRLFDLVIVPQHDHYAGRNVLHVTGALSLVTPEKLTSEKQKWSAVLSRLPAPRVAVLIGGNSRAHKMTANVADNLIENLQRLIADGNGLMITASRRTPDEIVQKLRQSLGGASVHFWDNHGDNPYHAYLAWADALLVTEDSVSMASEAISTGKPVYIVRMAGGSQRFKRFHDHIVACDYARWFTGILESWQPAQLDDMNRAVERLGQIIAPRDGVL